MHAFGDQRPLLAVSALDHVAVGAEVEEIGEAPQHGDGVGIEGVPGRGADTHRTTCDQGDFDQAGQVGSEVGGGQPIAADQYGLAALPRLAHPRVLGDWNVVDIGESGLKQRVLSIDEIRGFVGRD